MRHCQGDLAAVYPCATACGACLSRADADLAALDEAGMTVVDRADLSEVLDGFAAHLDAEHAGTDGKPHLALADKHARDMAPVLRLRAMLAAAQEDKR